MLYTIISILIMFILTVVSHMDGDPSKVMYYCTLTILLSQFFLKVEK